MRQKRIIILALLFIIVVIGLALVFGRKSSTTISEALSAPAGFNDAVSYGVGSAVVPNGNSFVNYNYGSGSSTSLGPNNSTGGLTNLDSLTVSSDKQYLLFHDEVATSGGFLASQLTQAGLDPTLDYWWIYNVASQTFTPLPQGILIAKFSGDSVVGLGSANGGEALTTYAPGSSRVVSSIPVTGSSDFFPVPGGDLLQTPDNAVLFTKNGTVSQSLYSSMLLVGVTGDGQTAIGVSNSHKLVLLNITKDSQSTIASNIVNPPVWMNTSATNGGAVLYSESAASSSESPSLNSYDILTKKNVEYQFTGSAQNFTKTSLTPIALIGSNTAVVSSSASSFYLVGNNLAHINL